MKNQWQPTYPSTSAFLLACEESDDALHLRQGCFRIPRHSQLIACNSDSKYLAQVVSILDQFPRLRENRLPPPRGSQSEAGCNLYLIPDVTYQKISVRQSWLNP